MSLVPEQSRRLFSAITVLAALLSGCRPANEYVPPPPPPVKIAQPVIQDVTTYLLATGTTEAVEKVDIRARVTGYLEKINFREGDDVQTGQVLYVIDKKPFLAERSKAEAALDVAKAEVEDAKAKFERAKPLAETGAVSQEELTEKQALYLVAQAKVKAAEANLDATELELSYTDVTSPIDGRVGKTLVDRGNLVGGALATLLTTVIKYQPIYATFNISERELLELMRQARRPNEGEKVDLSSIPFAAGLADERGYPHEGFLNYAELGVESSTGTYLIRGELPNSDLMFGPGMFVRVRIPTGKLPGAVVVPQRAVNFDQQGRYLLATDNQDKVVRRDVELGPAVDQARQVINKGLAPGEWVIIEGQQRAREGEPVTPTRVSLEESVGAIEISDVSEAVAAGDEETAAPDAAEDNEQAGPEESPSEENDSR